MICVGPGGTLGWTGGFHWPSCQESKHSTFWEEMPDLKGTFCLNRPTFGIIVISLHQTLFHLRVLF